ncbi:MAG TPA: GrpB family protein [Verrucomicrobiae bacterium]|nr:GrpB family protein [Verrucomicrobiae bacterium]
MITKREYSIEPYNPAWPLLFQEEAEVVRGIFGEHARAIHHVGSTSVPEMQAKPQIDILVLVDNLEVSDKHIPDFEAAGYTSFGDPFGIGARMFSRVEGNRKLSNVHVHIPSNPYVQQFLLVRDYLRVKPERATEYGSLKARLSTEFPDDYQAYRDGKKGYLDEVFAEAKAYFGKE